MYFWWKPTYVYIGSDWWCIALSPTQTLIKQVEKEMELKKIWNKNGKNENLEYLKLSYDTSLYIRKQHEKTGFS